VWRGFLSANEHDEGMSSRISQPRRIPAHIIRQIAVVAGRDPRTVAKVIAGRDDVRPEAAAAILTAAAQLRVELHAQQTQDIDAGALSHG
jgi:hypothetical protein